MQRSPLHLFEGYGVELEYMIVDRDSLSVLPVSDHLLKSVAGEFVPEVLRGVMAWCNELVLHVIEIKTNGPALSLTGLAGAFQLEVAEINNRLKALNGRLMPGAMHPWMDPFTEMRLWPHEYNSIYDAYNRIFDCRGHGWANLQSTHLNLPFEGDHEFEKLYAALRVITPLLPALAACSPIADRTQKRYLDYRMKVYSENSIRVPSLTGLIIPEAVFTKDDYYRYVFEPMYRDIAPYDPEGILQYEWLNSRGVMARFDRGAIEIRVMDVQECPKADIAILQLFSEATKLLVDEQWCSCTDQKSWHEGDLLEILMDVMKDGDRSLIKNKKYLQLFGINKPEAEAGEIWQHLFEEVKKFGNMDKLSRDVIQIILEHGPLGRRFLQAMSGDFSDFNLKRVYGSLCDCLHKGKLFIP